MFLLLTFIEGPKLGFQGSNDGLELVRIPKETQSIIDITTLVKVVSEDSGKMRAQLTQGSLGKLSHSNRRTLIRSSSPNLRMGGECW